jgi:hypothetical protein
MTLQPRDRRALTILGVAVLLAVVIYFLPSGGEVEVVRPADSLPLAEKRLARARQVAASVPAREDLLKQAMADLERREKGLIQADTAPQAQAQLLQILRRIGRAQAPPVEIKSTEIGQPKPFGQDYGEVFASISFECRIEQLLNMLADISAQPELIATSEIRILQANEKQKTIPVRLMVSGLVPKSLVPEKKGLTSF